MRTGRQTFAIINAPDTKATSINSCQMSSIETGALLKSVHKSSHCMDTARDVASLYFKKFLVSDCISLPDVSGAAHAMQPTDAYI